MVDPGTAMLIATAVATAAKGAGDFMSNKKADKASKMRAKETKRETLAGLYDEALNRSAELQAQRLNSRKRLGKAQGNALQDTASLVRGAFNI